VYSTVQCKTFVRKAVHRTLTALKPGVIFTNSNAQLLQAQIPKSAKKTDGLTVFLHF
jgi:hypothetical protein